MDTLSVWYHKSNGQAYTVNGVSASLFAYQASDLIPYVGNAASQDETQSSDQHKPGFNIPAALHELNANAMSTSCHACALYVRKAIQAGGINTSSHSGSAKDYGSFLVKWGFHTVTSNISSDNYTPVAGDIAVFDGFGNNIHGSWNGHIEMFNGTQWISDLGKTILHLVRDIDNHLTHMKFIVGK